MSLSHTILALLSESAYSGYDLSKQFEDAISCFWKASHQQIYRELAKMEGLGWIEPEIIPQTGKPDKKLYRIAALGKQELESWFELPCSPSPIREDLLVKVLAGADIPRSTLIRQLQEQRSIHQEILDCYLEHEAAFQLLQNPDERIVFRYLTLRRGIRYENEWVEWCDEVLAVLATELPIYCSEISEVATTDH